MEPFSYPRFQHSHHSSGLLPRQSNLYLPELLPPKTMTYYEGRWKLNLVNRHIWNRYKFLLDANQLPNNVSHDPSHWLGHCYPGDHFLTINSNWIEVQDSQRVHPSYYRQLQPIATPVTNYVASRIVLSPTYNVPPHFDAIQQSDKPPSIFSNIKGKFPIKANTSGNPLCSRWAWLAMIQATLEEIG